MANKEQEAVMQLAHQSTQIARNSMAVIDALMQRGAFRGEEATSIGNLRDQCQSVIQIAEDILNQDEE
jgi:hypothetical protein